jgi:hypothetical protein
MLQSWLQRDQNVLLLLYYHTLPYPLSHLIWNLQHTISLSVYYKFHYENKSIFNKIIIIACYSQMCTIGHLVWKTMAVCFPPHSDESCVNIVIHLTNTRISRALRSYSHAPLYHNMQIVYGIFHKKVCLIVWKICNTIFFHNENDY